MKIQTLSTKLLLIFLCLLAPYTYLQKRLWQEQSTCLMEQFLHAGIMMMAQRFVINIGQYFQTFFQNHQQIERHVQSSPTPQFL